MENRRYRSGRYSGFQYDKLTNQSKDNNSTSEEGNYAKKMDEDLIIEDNTVYEIDRECYERNKKQRRRKE